MQAIGRKPRKSLGFTLTELLLVIFLLGAIFGITYPYISSYVAIQRKLAVEATLHLAAQTVLTQIRDDVAYAAAGTGTGSPGAFSFGRFNSRRVGGAFISNDSQTLYVVRTTPDEVARIVSMKTESTSPHRWRLVLAGNTPGTWRNYLSNSSCIYFGPSTLQTLATATQFLTTTADDFTNVSDFQNYNPDLLATVIITPQPCTPLTPLIPNAPPPTSGNFVTMVSGITTYEITGAGGLRRTENAICAYPGTPPSTSEMVLSTNISGMFKFYRRDNTAISPIDPLLDNDEIVGIWCDFTFRDPDSGISVRCPMVIPVQEWIGYV